MEGSGQSGTPTDAQLAVLVALGRSGPLTAAQLAVLLNLDQPPSLAIEQLSQQGHIEAGGETLRITTSGARHLDEILEGIESQLAPDSAQYERRFRRQQPTLPFDANTVWAEAVCINIRVQPEQLRPLIPDLFALDLYQGHAFISLTASRLKDFGMGAVPKSLRMNFYQSTYRAHVTYTDFRGRTLRGCYFVRSETNSHVMSLTANLLPEFKAHRCATYPIVMVRDGDRFVLSVDSGDDPAGKVVLVLDTSQPLEQMPPSSAFASRQDAYDYIVDFHDAFSYDPDTGEVFILRIDRGDWDIKILDPVGCYLGYVADGPFLPGTAELDSVFYFQNVPYRWLPLIKERMKH